jgi:phosphatidylserine/phosphatidylglycerophosphate/cardiolipin synthase-like enzyme
MSRRSIIVLPDDTCKPILDAINGATKSLRIKMFVFSDPGLLNAVIAAKVRGVHVRVMLNPARRNGETDNVATRETLEKAMVVDDIMAFVKSHNWTTENLTATRDYAVTTTHPHEVDEIIDCFEADSRRTLFKVNDEARLIWCRGNGRERIARLIDDAKHTLFIQNERYQDPVIVERIVRASRRGVKIYIMAKPPHSLKMEKLVEGVGSLRILDDIGIKIHKLKQLKLHGKMLLADGERAIVGSINLAPGSFDDRRELAIEVDDSHIVERLEKIARHDWNHSHALDLTDEGLKSDLEKHGEEGDDSLALNVDKKS